MSSGRLNVSPERLGLGLDPLDSMLHRVTDRDDSWNLAALKRRRGTVPNARCRMALRPDVAGQPTKIAS